MDLYQAPMQYMYTSTEEKEALMKISEVYQT